LETNHHVDMTKTRRTD